jgi:hypothetical protein
MRKKVTCGMNMRAVLLRPIKDMRNDRLNDVDMSAAVIPSRDFFPRGESRGKVPRRQAGMTARGVVYPLGNDARVVQKCFISDCNWYFRAERSVRRTRESTLARAASIRRHPGHARNRAGDTDEFNRTDRSHRSLPLPPLPRRGPRRQRHRRHRHRYRRRRRRHRRPRRRSR